MALLHISGVKAFERLIRVLASDIFLLSFPAQENMVVIAAIRGGTTKHFWNESFFVLVEQPKVA